MCDTYEINGNGKPSNKVASKLVAPLIEGSNEIYKLELKESQALEVKMWNGATVWMHIRNITVYDIANNSKIDVLTDDRHFEEIKTKERDKGKYWRLDWNPSNFPVYDDPEPVNDCPNVPMLQEDDWRDEVY